MTLASTQYLGIQSIVHSAQTSSGNGAGNSPSASEAAGPDFSISVNPSIVRVDHGQSGSAAIFLTSMNSFSGVVSLSLLGNFQRTATLDLQPGSVTLGPGETASATITVFDDSSGISNGTVLGTSENTVHSASLTIVAAPS